MPTFWKHVNQVLKESDLVIEVLDARMIDETRNIEIEEKVKKLGKKIIYVLNKCDLADLERLKAEQKKLNPSVYVSSRDKFGTTILKKKILELSKGERVTIGIVGYPNVGKSSLINALSGSRSAKTSADSGYTKGCQKIRVDNKILLLDTPGVLPKKEKNDFKHSKTGTISYGKIKDAETVALQLIEEKSKIITEHYGVSGREPEEILSNIAFKYKKLSSGNKPNLEVAARMLLRDWQTGKIKY